MPDDDVTPFTTSAQLDELVRETLESFTGTMQVGGLVREALVSGLALYANASARSSAKLLSVFRLDIAGTARSISAVGSTMMILQPVSGSAWATSRAGLSTVPPVTIAGGTGINVSLIIT